MELIQRDGEIVLSMPWHESDDYESYGANDFTQSDFDVERCVCRAGAKCAYCMMREGSI